MTHLTEATEAREELDRQIAALQAKRAALDVDPLLEEAETLHQAWVVGSWIGGRCDAISLALAALRRGMELARPAEAMDDAAGRWPSDAELRDMAEDVGDTLEPALEMARLVREWQTGGAAKPEYGKVHADGSRSGGQPVSEPEWIDWHGGECPVSAGTRVTVEYHNGTLGHREGTSMRHDDWRIPGHIRRYRILGGVA